MVCNFRFRCSVLCFGESGAHVSDLATILFTHWHVDHSAEFPALIKSSYFEDRTTPLPVFGPDANVLVPSTDAFVRGFFQAPMVSIII
jgi:ribonuclease BN (tRNA processing enzyme)